MTTRPLSPAAQLALDRLTSGDPDEVLAIVLPHGLTPAERRLELRAHQLVVTELRAAGYAIDVQRRGTDNGEILTIGLVDGDVDDTPGPDAPQT